MGSLPSVPDFSLRPPENQAQMSINGKVCHRFETRNPEQVPESAEGLGSVREIRVKGNDLPLAKDVPIFVCVCRHASRSNGLVVAGNNETVVASSLQVISRRLNDFPPNPIRYDVEHAGAKD